MMTEWICPYCSVASLIEPTESVRSGWVACDLAGADGMMGLWCSFTLCRNPMCRRKTVRISLLQAERQLGSGGAISIAAKPGSAIAGPLQLLPPRGLRPMPAYVPEAVRSDYEEAVSIVELSPKAAATLARRALQGMIRDFQRIKKRTLAKEIGALKDRVDPLVWDAIDAVRSVGNIGAHMEKDINIIVDVEKAERANAKAAAQSDADREPAPEAARNGVNG